MSVSSVRIYVNTALEYLDSPNRVDDVEPKLVQAEQRLGYLSPDEAAPFVAQIADIRAKLSNMVSPADARQVSAAQGKIRQARDYIDRNHGNVTESDKDFIEELFRKAVEFLDNIADERKADKLKAPVLAEMSRIRAQYGITGAAAPDPTPALEPARDVPPGPNFSSAKRKVFWANDYFTSPGRFDQVEPELAQAEELLKGDWSHEAAALRSEIATLREKVADTVSPLEEAYVRSAQRGVQSIRNYIDKQREFLDRGDTKENLDRQLQKVIDEDLSRIKHPRHADQLKAPILAEIARVRAELGVATPTPTSSSQPRSQPAQAGAPSYSQARSDLPSSTPVDANDLSYDDKDRLNRARRTIGHARSNIESRRTDGVENLFFDATNLMAPVSPAHKDHLVAEIEQLRKDLEATRLAESTRNITGELDRKLRSVETDIENPHNLHYSVLSFKARLERSDVRRTLTPEAYREYETRLANLLAAGAAHSKAEALKCAQEPLQRLHEKLATNPFTGLEQYQANRVDGELRSMRLQVEKEIKKLPQDDADRLRIEEELKGTDAIFEAYSNEWAKAGIYEEVRSGWKMLLNEVQGWEQESIRSDAQLLDPPDMPQTRLAIRRVNYYLHGDTYVQRTRDENPGDSVIAKVDREAEQLLEAAGTKMASAFYRITEAAEKIETPIGDRWLREKPGDLISSARGTFEDTKFYKPVVDRIRALDQRWEDELTGAHDSRKKLGEKLSLEAIQKWPSIVAAISTVSYFDPSSARPGDVVHLQGVYNRAGWDFDGGQYGFSMRFNGVPLGGIYEPYVTEALDHAAYELKLTIDDHKEWDLVGVVLGPGSIKERTKRTIRRGMNTEEIEEWLPVDCLRLRIIALRAGPVVVGPQT